MQNLIANRIKNARKLNMLSLQEVADRIGVSKQMVSKYENGQSIPTSTRLIKLAKLFRQKVDYFFRAEQIELGEVNFRKKAKFGKKQQAALKEQIKIKLEDYLCLEDLLSIDHSFENVLANQTIQSVEDIEKVVLKLRTHWEIGVDPVHNIIQLLEDKFIKVIELKDLGEHFDGLACWANEQYPSIVVNGHFSVERKRFTLLHELAHLLLQIPNCERKEVENFCNQFAAEFLLPKHILIEEYGGKRKHVSLPELIASQKKYGLSIPAIIYRMVDAEILSEEQQKRFYQKMSNDPNLKAEVNQSRFETPEKSDRYERLVYRAASEENISISKASALLNTSINSVRQELASI